MTKARLSNPASTDEQVAGDAVVLLRWRSAGMGCLFPVMIGAMVLFGFAAFDADVLQDMAESRGRGVGLIQAIQ
jgi:hypothetical protein